jgi:hypothetical protein
MATPSISRFTSSKLARANEFHQVPEPGEYAALRRRLLFGHPRRWRLAPIVECVAGGA